MRVGILALQHESNTFLNAPTTFDDFLRHGIRTGSDVVDYYAGGHHEVAGFLFGLDYAGFEAVPIFAAGATPSGTIAAGTADRLLTMMFAQLQAAGDLDGLLVAPHGAAVSENHRDFDGHWLSQVRQYVGPATPIVCTLDPHANVSDRMVAACNATIAYRTNPHVDQFQTGCAAAKLLVRTLRDEITPMQALVRPPVSISIDKQETAADPCKPLYDMADRMLEEPGILSNSVVLGFPYADVAEMASAFIVVTDGDPAMAGAKAAELAEYLHANRLAYACGLIEVDEAIHAAERSAERTLLLDVGDNVGGGGPADGTVLVHALHQASIANSFACLYDPAAVQAASKAGRGAILRLNMGGHTDGRHGEPFSADVVVRMLTDGRFTETQPRHGGGTHWDMGPTAIVETARGLTLMLTTHRTPPFSLQQLIGSSLDPEQFHVLVAKGVNAPLAAYQSICPNTLRVNTPGVTCADATALPFRYRSRPLFPFEDMPAFSAR